MRATLERYFQFTELGTGWRQEILAGTTTFVTMAYILFVNPSILAEAGMPGGAVTAATCIAAAAGSLLMGGWARYPIAMAPGMGLNAYFTFSVVKGMGVSWQVALGAVFVSGVLFLAMTAAGIRQLILRVIPRELYSATAVGIGLFIAFLGLKNAGLVVAHPATFVTIGSFRNPAVLVSFGGILLSAALLARGVRAAFLLGIAATMGTGWALGLYDWKPLPYSVSDLTATFGQLDVGGSLRLGLVEIVCVFLFVDLFDNVGTLMAVGKRANLFDGVGRIPRLNRILTCDAVATICGSLCGTSTVVSYIESASGVAAGGRSGFTSIVTGLLFLAALPLAPLAGAIPLSATAPALVLVGALMVSHTREIEWSEPRLAVPAFLTILAIPLTFSIANGLALGFIAYAALQGLTGHAREAGWLMFVLAGLCVLRFLYLGGA